MTSVFAAARTPVCPVDGALSSLHPVDMAAAVLRQLVAECPIAADQIGEVWVGCAEPVGAQGADMARAAVLTAGWPIQIGGVVVDAAELSGTAALHGAIAAISSGAIEFAVVLGVSNSSLVPPGASALGRTYGRPWSDGPAARFEYDGGLLSPHRSAEAAASNSGISRADQDLAVTRSLDRRSSAAAADFVDPFVGRNRARRVEADVLRDLPDDLSSLPPAFDSDGEITAASFSPPADGVGGLILGRQESGGTSPPALGRILGVGRSASDPRSPAGGAAAAVDTALIAASLTAPDVGRWEIVESSAAALLVICRQLDLDPDRVNPFGGALATGDSAAAEEVRLLIDGLCPPSTGGPMLALVSGSTGAAATIFESHLNKVEQSAPS